MSPEEAQAFASRRPANEGSLQCGFSNKSRILTQTTDSEPAGDIRNLPVPFLDGGSFCRLLWSCERMRKDLRHNLE